MKKNTDRSSVHYSLQGTIDTKVFKAFSALGTITFSFGNAMLPEIQSTIKYPVKKNMYKGVSSAYGIIVMTYWTLAFLGYWAFGSQVQPYALSSLTVPGWAIVMTNFFAVIQISGCYQIYCRPTYAYFEENIYMNRKGDRRIIWRFFFNVNLHYNHNPNFSCNAVFRRFRSNMRCNWVYPSRFCSSRLGISDGWKISSKSELV